MFRKMYDWVMGLAGSRHAPTSLAVVSFAESSFFPIPPDVMLAPMVLARPDRAFVYAGICTAASVVGGLLGYAIGFYLEPVGMWLLSLMVNHIGATPTLAVGGMALICSICPMASICTACCKPRLSLPSYGD